MRTKVLTLVCGLACGLGISAAVNAAKDREMDSTRHSRGEGRSYSRTEESRFDREDDRDLEDHDRFAYRDREGRRFSDGEDSYPDDGDRIRFAAWESRGPGRPDDDRRPDFNRRDRRHDERRPVPGGDDRRPGRRDDDRRAHHDRRPDSEFDHGPLTALHHRDAEGPRGARSRSDRRGGHDFDRHFGGEHRSGDRFAHRRRGDGEHPREGHFGHDEQFEGRRHHQGPRFAHHEHSFPRGHERHHFAHHRHFREGGHHRPWHDGGFGGPRFARHEHGFGGRHHHRHHPHFHGPRPFGPVGGHFARRVDDRGFSGPGPRFPQQGPLFGRIDADHDGKITKEELLKVYTALDKDKDGAVTRQEFAEAVSSGFKPGGDAGKKDSHPGHPHPEGPGHPGRPHAGPGQDGPGRHGPPSAEQLLQRFDKAKKGTLSKEDVPERLWSRISAADADKDGVVSKEELETHFKNHPPRGPRQDKPAEKQPQEGAKPQEAKPDESKPQAKTNDADRPADATVIANA